MQGANVAIDVQPIFHSRLGSAPHSVVRWRNTASAFFRGQPEERFHGTAKNNRPRATKNIAALEKAISAAEKIKNKLSKSHDGWIYLRFYLQMT
jgi:hypothetical protein